jgi:Uma2 family endonuclease
LTRVSEYLGAISHLPAGASLRLEDISWEEYETLLDAIGEAPRLRMSYDQGTLLVMTLSPEHESYCDLIKLLIGQLSLKLRIKVLFFGSATMKIDRTKKGSEPDACFYVQTADSIGKRKRIDFNEDPPPDVVVEVDIHHSSKSRLSLYAALGVPEVWRYHKSELTVYLLHQGEYAEAPASRALPMLTSGALTDFLNRNEREDQYEILLAFESWLEKLERRNG